MQAHNASYLQIFLHRTLEQALSLPITNVSESKNHHSLDASSVYGALPASPVMVLSTSS